MGIPFLPEADRVLYVAALAARAEGAATVSMWHLLVGVTQYPGSPRALARLSGAVKEVAEAVDAMKAAAVYPGNAILTSAARAVLIQCNDIAEGQGVQGVRSADILYAWLNEYHKGQEYDDPRLAALSTGAIHHELPDAIDESRRALRSTRSLIHMRVSASKEARRLGHTNVTTAHALLALLSDEDCQAADLLQRLGVEVEDARSFVENELRNSGGNLQGQEY